jgi:hypothetical protein
MEHRVATILFRKEISVRSLYIQREALQFVIKHFYTIKFPNFLTYFIPDLYVIER